MNRHSPAKITLKQALGLIGPYVRRRLLEQIQSVALIILYLIFFQTIVLGVAIAEATVIALGLSLVVLGLMFFMEGLLLGLMPLGEIIGVKLPQKARSPVILTFAFILGLGATFAEPAIGVLKDAGSSVKPWEAPLLFALLNKHAGILVWSVGLGVGVAVVFGMLLFLRNWRLKIFIYLLVGILSGMTVLGFVLHTLGINDNILFLTGLAWDCGAVTTGPVTVPLVLALGIGISRIAGGGTSGPGGGFGVVTLASLFPVLAVLILGFAFIGHVPKPASSAAFFSAENRNQAVTVFESPEEMAGYALLNSDFNQENPCLQPIEALLGGDRTNVNAYVAGLHASAERRQAALGSSGPEVLERWVALHGDHDLKLLVFQNLERAKEAVARFARAGGEQVRAMELLLRNARAATIAILPLTLFLLVTLLLMREKLPQADEVCLGVFFALLGMGIFNIGIELGLTKLGNQVGAKLPASFTSIELVENRKTLSNFDPSTVLTAVTSTGEQERFFYTKEASRYVAVPYAETHFDPGTRQYTYAPRHGPLFGGNFGVTGIIVVLIFAFIMGYGATLAEPALNALGFKVEEITVGTFHKSLLTQTVAIGVGIGLALGVAKIVWDIPLVYLLVPPYLLLLFVTHISTDEFVNIGWDSAGVTTGPITVPLVLAMGLGIGGQVPGVVEGFGILSVASVSPTLSVLLVGLAVTRRRQAALKEVEPEQPKMEAMA